MNSKMFFLLGFFASMNCLGITIGNSHTTLFTITLLIIVGYRVVKEHKVILNNIQSLLGLMFVCMYITTFISNIVLPSEWVVSNIVYMVSMTLGIVGLYFSFGKDEIIFYKTPFLKGLLVNFKIQLMWSYVQFVCATVFNIPLNYVLHLYGSRSIAEGTFIQISGLGWERAEFCLVMVLGFVLSDNMIFRTLAIGSMIITGSRTGIIMAIVSIICCIDFKSMKKIKLAELISAVFIIGFIGINLDKIIFYVEGTIDKIINFRNDASGVTHAFYFEQVPFLLTKTPFINKLFGYGGASSGFMYGKYFSFNADKVWTVESTWLYYFWSFGIIGFTIWMIWMVKNIIFHFSRKNRELAVFSSIIVGGVFYTLIPNWALVVLLFISYFAYDERNVIKS